MTSFAVSKIAVLWAMGNQVSDYQSSIFNCHHLQFVIISNECSATNFNWLFITIKSKSTLNFIVKLRNTKKLAKVSRTFSSGRQSDRLEPFLRAVDYPIRRMPCRTVGSSLRQAAHTWIIAVFRLSGLGKIFGYVCCCVDLCLLPLHHQFLLIHIAQWGITNGMWDQKNNWKFDMNVYTLISTYMSFIVPKLLECNKRLCVDDVSSAV